MIEGQRHEPTCPDLVAEQEGRLVDEALPGQGRATSASPLLAWKLPLIGMVREPSGPNDHR